MGFVLMTNLQLTRKHRGLTQKQLAEKSGVSLKMIQKYEACEKDISHARAITVWKLAAVLGCEITDLFEVTPEINDAIYYIMSK